MTPVANEILVLGPQHNGILLSSDEFDHAEFEAGWRYELIHGVLIVTSTPLREERDPNEELGYLLRRYREDHSDGATLDATLSEEVVYVGAHRRRADRAIWTGLGRLPSEQETPSIIVEFVSAGRRNRHRDYEEKRDEYLSVGVQEYWVFDRFERTMTVFRQGRGPSPRKEVLANSDVYVTTLLPGFQLPLARLFQIASRWE